MELLDQQTIMLIEMPFTEERLKQFATTYCEVTPDNKLRVHCLGSYQVLENRPLDSGGGIWIGQIHCPCSILGEATYLTNSSTDIRSVGGIFNGFLKENFPNEWAKEFPRLTDEEVLRKLKGYKNISKVWLNVFGKETVDLELAKIIAYYSYSERMGYGEKGDYQLRRILFEGGRDEDRVERAVFSIEALRESDLLDTWEPDNKELIAPSVDSIVRSEIQRMESRGFYITDYGFRGKKNEDDFVKAVLRTNDPIYSCERIAKFLDQHQLIGTGGKNPYVAELHDILVETGVVKPSVTRVREDGNPAGLSLNEKGIPLPTKGNINKVLTWDRELVNLIRHNEFTRKFEMAARLPLFLSQADDDQYIDKHATDLSVYIEEKYGLILGSNLVDEMLRSYGQDRRYHPVRDHLNGLRWDGVKRVETWLLNYVKTPDTAYERFVGQSTLVSAVARVMQPGCQVDTMLVLEGKKGVRKSTVVRVLAYDKWYKDDSLNVAAGNNNLFMGLLGAWLYEIPEMHWNRSEASAIKAFLTKPRDDYREPYARQTVSVPRQCVFIGTVNPGSSSFFDASPERRFLPVVVKDYIDIDGLVRDRDQLWAEAVVMYKNGVKWHWTPSSEIASAIEEEQALRFEKDSMFGIVHKWLYETYREEVTVMQIAEVVQGDHFRPDKVMRADQMRIGNILSELGWTRTRRNRGGVRTYYYARPTTPLTKTLREVAKDSMNTDEFWARMTEHCNGSKELMSLLDKFDETVSELDSLCDYLRYA